mgnify:CR=1 FL=1
MSDNGFTTANAAFIDLLIGRWERIIEHHTLVRYSNPEDEDAIGQRDAILSQLGELDSAIAEYRAQTQKEGRLFPIDQMVLTYELDPVEAQILQLALMPQLDLSFRQRIARYNNNILYDFVDVDLALALLFPSRIERLQGRNYFAANAPLIRHNLLAFAVPKDAKGSGVLAQEVRPPARLADFVLCRRSLDTSLRHLATLDDPAVKLDEVALPDEAVSELDSFLAYFQGSQQTSKLGRGGPFPDGGGMTIAFVGGPGTGKTMISEAIAGHLERPILTVDSGRLAGIPDQAHIIIGQLFTEARVQGAVLFFDRCEPLFSKANPKLPELFSQMERFGGLTILATSLPDDLDPGVERHITWQLFLEVPEVEQRTLIWKNLLPKTVALDPSVDVEDLGTRFEVTGGQIRNACILAETRALTKSGGPTPLTMDDLKSAAYAQLRADMRDYSVKSKVNLTLDSLVLPDKEMTLIREVLQACKNRVFVMSKWGFGRRLVTGKGICVLFKGEPGTGKTFCAEILSSELGIKLYQISIPKIVSKYIGETEKNIAKIFATARANHSMLLFDEADSLFTKRVSVESSIDRFSNMETNLLLQEIERFEGITLLTTNLDKNMDDAFARRIQFKIDFPFPTPENRAVIWRSMIPKECPIADDIDFDELGDNFELSGGYIKNAVVRAAYRAAAREESITWDDIEFAAEQECKSAGKLFRSSSSRSEW